jgi:hypothetical protein
MTKEEFGYYAMLYGCEDLGLDPVEIVLFTGFFMGNPEINAVAKMKDRKIAIQEDWFKKASFDEIALSIFHELRHFYQHRQITLFNEIEKSVSAYTIDKWKYNFKHNIKPNGENDINYLTQDIEKDADKYSKITYQSFVYFIKKSTNNKF